jgi:two-component system chemotaxis sensor kinase CheA
VASSLLRLVDAVRAVLTEIEATGTEPAVDHDALVAELRAHLPDDDDGSQPEPQQRPVVPQEEPAAVATSGEGSVRVDVGVLDRLMDLVGELVLTRSRIGEIASADDEGPLWAPYRDLRVVSADLQESVMTARLQPVGTVTGKFPRIARDLAPRSASRWWCASRARTWAWTRR